MKQPAANHRPIHAGYPSDEPLRVGGPGRDFGPPLGVVCAAPGTHAAVAAALGARVQAEFDAGAEHVRIDAIDPADADYVPHDMLVIDGRPVADAVFSVEGDPDDWAATFEPSKDFRPASEFAGAFDLRAGIGRIDEFRMPRPLVWLDELTDWPDEAAFAALASHDRQRNDNRAAAHSPQPGESTLPAGFTARAADALRAFCESVAP